MNQTMNGPGGPVNLSQYISVTTPSVMSTGSVAQMMRAT